MRPPFFRLGAETSTPVIDLHAYAMQAIKADGREASKAWFLPRRLHHPNDFGAYKAAGFIGGALAESWAFSRRPAPPGSPAAFVSRWRRRPI